MTGAGLHDHQGRSRRGRLTVLVVFAVLAVLVAATVVVVPALRAPRASSTTVAVVGDSITYFAGQEISTALGGAYDADVNGQIGQRIDQMLPILQDAVHKHPVALVVNLGTNDALQAQIHPDWRTGFGDMIATVGRARCVVLTTISTLIEGPSAVPTVASEINNAITGAVRAHPNLHRVDWNAAVHAPGGGGLLLPDKIHPSDAGKLALARLLRGAVDHDCRAT
jgi:lysophospholipase L1-like esterase